MSAKKRRHRVGRPEPTRPAGPAAAAAPSPAAAPGTATGSATGSATGTGKPAGSTPTATSRPPTPAPSPDGPAAPVPAPVPAPPRDPASARLTDHRPTLDTLDALPLEEHAAVLEAVHADLASTLRQAES